MSQIVLHYRKDIIDQELYCLIETQGSIKTSKDEEEGGGCGDIRGLRIGKVRRDIRPGTDESINPKEIKENEAAYFEIGSHCLKGKIVKLPKPIAVLRKDHTRSSSPETEMRQENGEGEGDQAQIFKKIHYDIEAILKYKFIFSTRPDIVLANTLKNLPSFI
ncbi:hypothetical protein H4219_002816 [Mycoemilia scoparia]|uniref:Uncharacterized protein n=1 Tax=Mycoemilia scoparia TaxID=417184 RepID=A0A9W7ZXB5_9FUNG|nr:hypothetical protein H4219_002816 [Mycoemilia scoparia]